MIIPALGHQLVMRAALDDFAVAHDQNQVGVADGRQPVRDEERGAPRQNVADGFLNQALEIGRASCRERVWQLV